MSSARSSRTSISPSAWIGLGMLLRVVAIGVFGRYFAPYPPDEIFGAPFSSPSGDHWLGLDYAGRDVWSRFLWGGRTAILVALAGTVFGFLLGAASDSSPPTGGLGRRGARSHHRSRTRLPGSDPLAPPARRLRHEYRARRLRNRDHDSAGRCTHRASRHARDRRSPLRRVGARPRRALELRDGDRDPARRAKPAAGRLRVAIDDRHPPRRRPELRRARPAAACRRLGSHDRREPHRPQPAAVAGHRARCCDRHPHDRGQPDHRRGRASHVRRPHTAAGSRV